MPYFYDLTRTSTSAIAASAAQVAWAKTIAAQETLALYGMFASFRSTSAGGGTFRMADNTSSGSLASGGSSATPQPKNRRGSAAAQSLWFNDASAITASSLGQNPRVIAGFAATGGMGGYVPLVPQQAIQMMTSSTTQFNPVDWEFTSITSSSGLYDWVIDIGEGI